MSLVSKNLVSDCLAKDFGTKGHSYPIVEQPFLEMIEQRLGRVDIEREQQKMQERAKKKVEEPTAVIGIAQAEQNRIFYYDPTYELKEDIKLPCGKILHKAGTRINPLEHMSLDRRLFFLNSNDPKQVAWLKEEITLPKTFQAMDLKIRGEHPECINIHEDVRFPKFSKTQSLKCFGYNPTKHQGQEQILEDRIILVAGRPFDLEQQIGQPVYFDQLGGITTQLGIKAVPAIAVQDGLKIKIREVAVE